MENFPIGHAAHTVTPTAALYFPEVQAVQTEAPADDEYPPIEHNEQTPDELPPVASLNVPGMQLVHTVSPLILENVPRKHGVRAPESE